MKGKRDTVLQTIKDERYLVRESHSAYNKSALWDSRGTLRLGEVIYSGGQWYYISRTGTSNEGYQTREQAEDALFEASMKRNKKPSDYPRLQFRIPQERID